MKIATWNLERPTEKGHKTPEILKSLVDLDADILVLTETNDFINLGDKYRTFHTEDFLGTFYKPGDKQVSIFSKYPIIRQLSTFRNDTSLCVEIETPNQNLIVYGTIIGNFGNRGDQFSGDLEKQLIDFATIGKDKNFCIAGDLNISFSDNFYFTAAGREQLMKSFSLLGMQIMTEEIPKNIDHIVLSESFTRDRGTTFGFWNDTENKEHRLSDHKGVFVELV